MIQATRARRLSAAVLVVFALAACGGGQGGGAKADTSPIKIGFILSLTGTFAANGKNEQNGWTLAQKQLGDTVSGRKIETIFADDQTDPNVALSDARDLVERNGVVMLEGPIPANAIGAVASYAGPHGIPMDDWSLCSEPQIKSYKQIGNAFTSVWNCDQPALIMGQWLYDQGYRHITTVGLDYSYGWIAVGSLMASFKKAGGSIDKSIWAPITTPDFSPYIPQIPQNTDAVFALMAGAASAKFTAAYRQFGLKGKIPLVGSGTLTDYSALPAMDPDAAIGIRVASQYCDGTDTPENNKFANEYKTAYGVYPGYYSDGGYTKYRLLLTALQKLNGNVSDPKKLISTIKGTAIQAPRGPVKLSPVTNSPIQNIYICEVKRVGADLRNVPIKTYKDVQPWGTLEQQQWLDIFAKNANTRPTG